MRTPSYSYRRELRVNMTPMIDVVFLLIIFFLVSSHLARQESQLPLPLPMAQSGEEVDDVQRDRVIVNVLGDGSLMLAGRNVSAEELRRRLSNEVNDVGSDLEVRIRSDRAVAFQFVQPILSAVSKSGVRNVTFAVTKPTTRSQ
jgi:biopolymer transport protein ExbD